MLGTLMTKGTSPLLPLPRVSPFRAQSGHVLSQRFRHRWCQGPGKEREGSRGAGDAAPCISKVWSPEREPQQEDLGGSRGNDRHRSFFFRRTPGDRGSWRCEHPGETGARPSEGEREEKGFYSGCCSFIVPPPRTATRQQEQEGLRCPRGHCLHICEASRSNFAFGGSIVALVGETSTPNASLHLSRGMVHLHRPCACWGPGPPPPSVLVYGLDGGPGDGLRQPAGMQ
jgi:hypothetical protein